MVQNKLVSRESLMNFYINLVNTKLQCNEYETREKLIGLVCFFEENILEKNKENINDLKRYLYTKMKNAKSESENKRYYEMYRSLKEIG